jgi:hypothetical protein
VIVREPKTAKGQPPDLLSFDGCVGKYRRCVEDILPGDKTDQSIELLRELRYSKDVGEVVRAVA